MGSGNHSNKSGPDWARRVSATAVALLGLAAVLVTVLAGVAVARSAPGPAATSASPATVVPYQYVTKAYTELLGRAPTPAEWSAAVLSFQHQGCTTTALIQLGDSIAASAEYQRDYPDGDAGSRALTLYRFVLNREPDASEYVTMRDRLAGSAAIPQLTPEDAANFLYQSPEFTTLTQPAICSPTNPSYYFGQPGDLTGFPAIPTPASGDPGTDQAEGPLQLKLDTLSLAGGGVVSLPAREVVGLTTTLTIPGNVTLTTAGNPGPTRYADMARLVRAPFFAANAGNPSPDLVHLGPGAKLEHLWVDGQRDAPDPNSLAVFNIRMLGGVGTTVESDRIGNAYGASNLEDDVQPPTPGDPGGCSGNVVADNLVEGYATAHGGTVPGETTTDHPEADGFGIYCGSTDVRGNTIIDVSDAAIVLFNGSPTGGPAPPQLSVVAGNTIISAGNSLYWGIVTDPFWSLHVGPAPGGDPPGTVTRAFAFGPVHSAVIIDNRLWSGDRTHFDVILSSGTHELFGSTVHQNCLLPNSGGQPTCGGGRNAAGAEWMGNSSAGLPSWAQMGIYVGGTQDAVVRGNRFPDLGHVTDGACPKGTVVVAYGNGATTDFAPGLQIDVPVTRDVALRSDLCITPSF
ncbi:MAG TPA: hypothetical protein VND67_07005 [Acidimicrobiales bacterium]|nr:hypothetical protein [Acidimicrobiales bacterium]